MLFRRSHEIPLQVTTAVTWATIVVEKAPHFVVVVVYLQGKGWRYNTRLHQHISTSSRIMMTPTWAGDLQLEHTSTLQDRTSTTKYMCILLGSTFGRLPCLSGSPTAQHTAVAPPCVEVDRIPAILERNGYPVTLLPPTPSRFEAPLDTRGSICWTNRE